MNYMEYESENKSGFKKRFSIFVICLIALLIIAWAALFLKMLDYQNKTDAADGSDHVSKNEMASNNSVENLINTQEYCLNYIKQLDDDKWIELYRANKPDCIDSDEDIVGFLRENIYPYKSSIYRAFDYSNDKPAFCLGTKDMCVASFVFLHNNEDFELSNGNIFKFGDENISINAFSDASVFINDILFEGQPDAEEVAVLDGYEDALINPISMNSYSISDVINPDVSINVDDSFETFDGFYYPKAHDHDELISKSEDFVKTLLRYYSQGKNNIQGNMSAVLALVDSSSEAAKVIRNTESGMEWVPSDNSISLEVECEAVCKLADNCIFAEVNCKSGNIYRVYYLDTGSGYKIVQFACVL